MIRKTTNSLCFVMFMQKLKWFCAGPYHPEVMWRLLSPDLRHHLRLGSRHGGNDATVPQKTFFFKKKTNIDKEGDAGLKGVGDPVEVGMGNKSCELCAGQTLASPGSMAGVQETLS